MHHFFDHDTQFDWNVYFPSAVLSATNSEIRILIKNTNAVFFFLEIDENRN